MKDNEIVEYKDSFWVKIRKLFSSLFKKRRTEINNNSNIKNELNTEEKEFIDSIKVEKNDLVKKEFIKEEFLKEIDNNIDTLKKLSVDRLKVLEKYYDNVIKENEIKIQKLS